MTLRVTTILRSVVLLALVAAMITNISYAQPKRNFLIEEATGTWCGPCGLNGKPAMDAVLKKYDNVYGVELHLSDDYSFEHGNEVCGAFGATSIPTGLISRVYWPDGQGGGTFRIYPTQWDGILNQLTDIDAQVQVKLLYEVDNAAKKIICNISAEFTEDINYTTRFNIYVVENGIIGRQNVSGQGYIDPFTHNHVARYLIEPHGVENSIPTPAKKGTKYEQTYEIPIDPKWNMNNIELLGFVQFFVDGTIYEIMNVTKGEEGAPVIEVTPDQTPNHAAIASGEKMTKEYTVKNITEMSQKYKVQLKKSDRTPEDWTVAVSDDGSETITIGAGESKVFSIDFTPGTTVGIGDATVIIYPEDDYSSNEEFSYTAISKEVESLEILGNDETGDVAQYQSQLENMVTIFVDDAKEVASALSNVTTLIFNTGQVSRLTDNEAAMIKMFLQNNANVLICGAAAAYDMENTATSEKIFPMIGAKYVDYIDADEIDAGASYRVLGVDGDPISDGMSISAKRNSFEIGVVGANSAGAEDFLSVEGTSYSIGVRSTMENNKAVVLGFNLGDINVDNNKSVLLNKIIEWLGAAAAMGPSIAVDGDVEFENTDIGQTSEQTFVISNDGDQTLSVSDLKVEESMQNVFTFPDVYDEGLFEPFEIEAGATKSIKAVFAPAQEKEYSTTLIIESNASNQLPDVNIMGEGFDPNSVEDIAEMSEFKVQPNPMSTNGTIHYTVEGNYVSKLTIDLIDVTGKKVMNLVNSSNAKTSDQIEIPVDQLTNGTYYAIARINGKMLQLQVVVAK
jgi:hypothetical protein